MDVRVPGRTPDVNRPPDVRRSHYKTLSPPTCQCVKSSHVPRQQVAQLMRQWGWTYEQIGKAFGVSRERARQIAMKPNSEPAALIGPCCELSLRDAAALLAHPGARETLDTIAVMSYDANPQENGD